MPEPLVIDLVAGHRITGRSHEFEHRHVGSGRRTRLTGWHYDCTCGELFYATADQATRHVQSLRARSVPVP